MSIGRRGVVIAISIIAGATAAAAAAWLSYEQAVPPINADDPRQVALGRGLYAAHCAQCHGASLEGQPDWQDRQANGRLPAPPLDANGHAWHHPDELLFGIAKRGLGPYAPAGYESDMPAFEGILGDEELAAAIAFVKSTWPPHIRQQQERMNEHWRQSGVSP
jgi:mono/diheme cytochrome c family protein